jgi:ADP-ribosyl-[dinitrogen reductase] hydrolase
VAQASETKKDRARRMRNALWGLFIGDALAMPVHWFYDRDNIRRVFNGGLSGYEDAPHPHPESFMAGVAYRPDVEAARRHGRRHDILHQHARFYDTGFSDAAIEPADTENRFHYHHGLKAGENTLGANLVRVLLRSVIREGRYDPDAFLADFVSFMTTPGANRDPYLETCLRRWFENHSRGADPRLCAAFQRDEFSIGSLGGVIRPLAASLTAEGACQGFGVAVEHQNLTHRSESVASALIILVPLLHGLLKGADPIRILRTHAGHLRLPKVGGEELRGTYRRHGGPGNIPPAEMWRLHNELCAEAFDIEAFLAEHEDDEDACRRLSTACYPEHGLPLLLHTARKHEFEFTASLLANANLGGDNVHRGMILGMLVGAAATELDEGWLRPLREMEALGSEIGEFVETVVG